MNSLEELNEVRRENKKTGVKNLKLNTNGSTFYLGEIRLSDGLKKKGFTLNTPSLVEAFERFKHRDWGYTHLDVKINEACLNSGYGDVLGIYTIDGVKVWIQTDFTEDTVTTIYLPEEH